MFPVPLARFPGPATQDSISHIAPSHSRTAVGRLESYLGVKVVSCTPPLCAATSKPWADKGSLVVQFADSEALSSPALPSLRQHPPLRKHAQNLMLTFPGPALGRLQAIVRAKANTVRLTGFRTYLVNAETQGPSDLPPAEAWVNPRNDVRFFRGPD
jgi:hypothetical protein